MGQHIVAQRDVLGLSVEALALRTGLPIPRLQAYEAGQHRVLAPDLLLLCAALQVGPAYFFDGFLGPEGAGEHEPEDDIGIAGTRYLA